MATHTTQASSKSKDNPEPQTPPAIPRLLIEEWLPAAAIGVECIRERSTGQQPPDKRLHVWWARRPLIVSRAAVLGSLLPADFPRDVFERLLGFWGSSRQLLDAQTLLDWARLNKRKIPNPHGPRAFKRQIGAADLLSAQERIEKLWTGEVVVIDPMAGGGSIPLESARLGLNTLANEYNPVACSVLEATVDYPFRYGMELGSKSRKWGKVLRERFNERMERFFPKTGALPPHCYIFARTVPCPDTQHHTPLVPDWHLLKPKTGVRVAAEPILDKANGTWKIRVRTLGRGAGEVREPPKPTYADGKGISLFTGHQITSDYIKAKAQAGEMKSALYAVVVKTPKGLAFQPPDSADLKALAKAGAELARLRPDWERRNIIPSERIPTGDKTGSGEGKGTDLPLKRGEGYWTDMFAPRQLLCMGTLVEELQNLRREIIKAEGEEMGEAVAHLLTIMLDKFLSHNSQQSRWDPLNTKLTNIFERHDFGFRPTFGEMAPCNAGAGLDWVVESVTAAYEALSTLPHASTAVPVTISLGTATSLPQIADRSMTAVVVDPPYADNVQYAELADFFYVWLKRTQGHRRAEWFSTYLCEHDQEAVLNVSRHRQNGDLPKVARQRAHAFYQQLMADVFREARRILRDDGVLTVMFTHKKQEAWEALFTSLVSAGFTITATWPVKTESEHSLHQARKNAAQSTVILVARKRPAGAGIGYFEDLKSEIHDKARSTAGRLRDEGLNPVDQLVGSFGPAMEVYSRYDQVRTYTGAAVGVDKAIEVASDAVAAWRIAQLAERGLEGVEPEGQFALLCWDVLGAAEFRFNEAMLLGKAVGMDVDQVIVAGLITRSSDKIKILPAKERRRERALEPEEIHETLFGPEITKKRRTKKQVLKVHPNDPEFRTAIDACHALALRFIEAGGGNAGIGAARQLVRKQAWKPESPVARLMQALVTAAPEAVRHEKGRKSVAAEFPEFRAWHELLEPLFGIPAPDWTEKKPPQSDLFPQSAELEDPDEVDDESEEAAEE